MIALLLRIFKITNGYEKRIALATVFSFLKALASKAVIIMSFYVIAAFMDNTVTAEFCLASGGILIISVILQGVFQNIADRLQSASGFEIFAHLRKQLGTHLLKLPMGYFSEGNIGRISSVLSTDMLFIEENLMSVIADLISYLFSAFIFIVFMFFFNIKLGILAFAVSFVYYIIGEAMKKNTLMHSEERQQALQNLTSSVLEFTEGIGIIKSYNLLGEKSKELTESFSENCKKNISFENDHSPWTFAINITYGLGTTAMLYLSWTLYKDGTLSLTYFVGMLLFLFELFMPIKSFYSQTARITVMNSCMDRIEAIFANEELPDDGEELLPANGGLNESEIEFRNLSFAYDKREVLKNISFKVEKNTMTALVGASGSGKSTIANLLPRFWDVKDKTIFVRGKDIRTVKLSSLMDNISMVFQRVYLFKDTIYNNIAIGRADASKEEVIAAARKARCYDFIMALPEGFDTVIGEGGATLSGGEKQRVSIARCILKDAPIVILDEATASVDADNESHIQAAISELVKGKTLLVIAHRLHTISRAEQILVIDEGQIKERGTHEELEALGGIYKNMISKRGSSTGFMNR